MATRQTALLLYRALLRESKSISPFSVRKPLDQEWGSYGFSPAGLAYHYEAVEQLVPGLEEMPPLGPLTAEALTRLVRDNFKSNMHRTPGQCSGLLDQGFAALRAIPEQSYLEDCSSSGRTEGVWVEATSCHSGVSAAPREEDSRSGAVAASSSSGATSLPPGHRPSSSGQQHMFTYRIRVTNESEQIVQVLGREWVIVDADGGLAGVVRPSPHNAVVGQQPRIGPGGCFQYYSGCQLPTPTGEMRGKLLMAVCSNSGSGRFSHDRHFSVPIPAFRLQPPHHTP